MKKAFILGNPRSGTSLFRIMLNCHSEIAAPPECGFLQWLYNKYRNWSEDWLENEKKQEFLDDLLSSKKIETWDIDKDELAHFLELQRPSNYGELTETIYYFWASKNGKNPNVIVDKNNYYIHHFSQINGIWPDASYLLLVRDGRDVACSYLDLQQLDTDSSYKPELPGKIEEIAQEWSKNNERILSFFETLTSERFLKVKFEDLVAETEATLKKVCHFLGMRFEKKMLLYYRINRQKQMEPQETLDWKKKTLEKPDINKINRYKKILSDRDVSRFNKIAGSMLKEFSYSI